MKNSYIYFFENDSYKRLFPACCKLCTSSEDFHNCVFIVVFCPNKIWFWNWTKVLIISLFSVVFIRLKNKRQTIFLNHVYLFYVKRHAHIFTKHKWNKLGPLHKAVNRHLTSFCYQAQWKSLGMPKVKGNIGVAEKKEKKVFIYLVTFNKKLLSTWISAKSLLQKLLIHYYCEK